MTATPQPPGCVTILGIDPGTGRCGVALVVVPSQGEPTLLEARTLHGGPKGQDHADQRIQQIAGVLVEMVNRAHVNSFGPLRLHLAYETPYSRTGGKGAGHAGLEQVWKLIGAAIATEATRTLPTFAISTSAVAAQFRATGLGREAKKRAAVEWARLRFGLSLTEADHDAAEAIAVAFAAGKVWRERCLREASERHQPRLTGPRGGKL